MHSIDDYDKKILQYLQQDNRMTADELSDKVNLSQSAIQRRITKLRDNDIIEADISIISPEVIGIGVMCVIDVILHEGNSKVIDEFKTAMKNCIEVMQCYYVTGTYDFVLIIQTKDMHHFEEFQKMYLMNNKHLKHFYTHVVMDKVKVKYGINL